MLGAWAAMGDAMWDDDGDDDEDGGSQSAGIAVNIVHDPSARTDGAAGTRVTCVTYVSCKLLSQQVANRVKPSVRK